MGSGVWPLGVVDQVAADRHRAAAGIVEPDRVGAVVDPQEPAAADRQAAGRRQAGPVAQLQFGQAPGQMSTLGPVRG